MRTLELKNYVNGRQEIGVGRLAVGRELADRPGEKSRTIHPCGDASELETPA